MTSKRKTLGAEVRILLVVLCALVLVPGDTLAYLQPAQSPQQAQPAASPGEQASLIPPDQLDSLVAPIALYPDPLLAQTLAASTYPLEIIQLQQWLTRNPGLKDKALADAVAKQPWDPSVQAMAALPDVVKLLADDIQWTTDLGNAFLAQQNDVMNAVQRMRQKAQDKGSLKSTEQQKVETKTVEDKTVIVVEQANPEVVYVPSYNPVEVYGAPAYPYPPVAYPSAGYYAATAALSFGTGVAMGAFWSGGWGWNCGWGGHNEINVNRNNNFNRNANVAAGNRAGTWQHNPQHRAGTPYADRATANRYGGASRGASLSTRQAGTRQQLGQQGGSLASSRTGAGGAGGGNLAGGRGVGAQAGTFGAGGADRVGSRDLSRQGGGSHDAFGGGSRGFSGSSALASSSRGASSMGSRGGSFGGRSGGGRSFGGGRGGGRRR